MKFISSLYDPEIGISTTTVQHLGVKFTATAKVHPSDKEKASKYAGCSYAETKAMIQALKYERRLAKEKADQALDYVKSCEGYANFDKESPTAKVMYRQLNQRIKRVNDLADEINSLYKKLQFAIADREAVLNAIDRRKARKDN